jgi:hypothetical protein
MAKKKSILTLLKERNKEAEKEKNNEVKKDTVKEEKEIKCSKE